MAEEYTARRAQVVEEPEQVAQASAPTHQVVDSRTGQVMGSYISLTRAHRAADRLDNAYGAVRYIVKPILLPRT